MQSCAAQNLVVGTFYFAGTYALKETHPTSTYIQAIEQSYRCFLKMFYLPFLTWLIIYSVFPSDGSICSTYCQPISNSIMKFNSNHELWNHIFNMIEVW